MFLLCVRAWGEIEAGDPESPANRKRRGSPRTRAAGRTVGTCTTVALGKGQKLVKSTLCSRFLPEVCGGPSLLASPELWAQVSLQFSVASPNLEGELHRQSPARPSPHGPGWRGKEAGPRQPPVRAAGAGTEQAIDIQGPQWNPVRQGQKGEGRKGASYA